MNFTSFLAQLWGPIILATSIGIFVSGSYYAKIYRDLEKEPFAIFSFGMLATFLGILHVLGHNAWNSLSQIIVSILGWALLLKGVSFLISPRLADKGGNWVIKMKIMPVIRVLMLIIGLYLVWIGYFS